MVDPKEFRVGNCVQFMGQPNKNLYYKVRAVYDDCIYINEIEDSWVLNEDIMPIPLTEEWMVKFGFEMHLHKNGFSEAKRLFMAGMFGDGVFELHYYEYAPCIYVHQLQNLYFALTGDELTTPKLSPQR